MMYQVNPEEKLWILKKKTEHYVHRDNYVLGTGASLLLILEITTIIASLNTYEGSVKSVQMLSLRRWLNEDGWGGAGQKY